MAVTSDIVRTWYKPRAVMARLLSMGQREDRAVAYLMAACFVIFIAQWPRLSRTAAGFDLAPGVETPELSRLLAYELFAWIMLWPLGFYIIAACSHLIAKLFRGKGTHYGARLALFWALLATTPAALLYGLMAGFIGPDTGTQFVGMIWLVGFVVIWLQCLRTVESGDYEG